MSSNSIAAYAFEQLEASPAASAGDIADVLSAVRAEADQIREQARAAGEAEGHAAGIAAARADAEPALAALARALDEVERARAELVGQLERDAVELALALTEQILAGVVSVQPERVIDVARHALRHLSDRRRVTLVVNPSDLELLSDSVEQLTSQLGGIEHLAVQADRRVDRGSAIARTDAGEIDASLENQLLRAREIAAQELAGDGS